MVFGYRWGRNVGWIGLLVVNQEFRCQGIGRALLSKQVQELRQAGCVTIGLDSVPEMRQFYASEGFVRDQKSLRLAICRVEGTPQGYVKTATKDDLPEICLFDQQATELDRSQLLRSMLRCFPGSILIYLSDRRIEGYMGFRDHSDSVQIGPWISTSPQMAGNMLKYYFHHLHPAKKTIKVGALEKGITVECLKTLGFEEVAFSFRMYWGVPLQTSIDFFTCIGDPAKG